MQRLVTLADAAITDEALFDGFTRLKFGADWCDAFASRAATDAAGADHG
jgi:hypothetical protein